jgi:tetratricopeptide (TPR) repeat protein
MSSSTFELLQQCIRLYQNHRFDEAMACCKEILAKDKHNVDAWNASGLIYIATNTFDKAVKSFEKALKKDKNNLTILMNYATALEKNNNLQKARSIYSKLLKRTPDNYFVLNNLANVLIALEALEDVAPLLEQAIKIEPDRAEAYNNLGLYFDMKGLYNQALENYQHAIRLSPEKPLYRLHAAFIHGILGQHEEAIDCCNQALEIEPNFINAYIRLGRLSAELGRFEEAEEAFRKALNIAPNIDAFAQLTILETLGINDPLFKKMEAQLQLPTITTDDKFTLAFALARIYDKAGSYEKAFENAQLANRLKRKTINYKIEDDLKTFRQHQQTITKEFIEENTNTTTYEITPIFIVGMPRSGTTLIEQIIASHPQVVGAGELDFFKESLTAPLHANPDPPAQQGKFSVEAVAENYIRKIKPMIGTHLFVTDKLPFNFEFIGHIKMAFPNAKIIHATRNPMDIVISNYMINFGRDVKFAYDLEEIAKYYTGYKDLMDHWGQLFNKEILEVPYEKIISDQKTYTRKILEYCGLPFHEDTLNFHKNKSVVKTASFVQVRTPIYTKSKERWKNYETHISHLLNKFPCLNE